ncbi:MAG: helix-turn-helix transcriptional regulator [Ardenticatenaceae bacterium]|nr:helix-turn-helix transcriptional regulator [Ardenticatenaceae bacterium]
MGTRSYHQVCPLAYALDIVGERWTLLMVREMAHGPRRFSDLQRSLPGMGANLLTDRLRKLEEFGLIHQRLLPPPAASTVYELTEKGDLLRPILGALSQFGLQFMPLPPPDADSITPNSLVGILRFRFNPVASGAQAHRVELHLDSDVVFAIIEQGRIRTGYSSVDEATLVLEGDPRKLFQLFLHEITPAAAVTSENVTIKQGELAELEAFWNCFRSIE